MISWIELLNRIGLAYHDYYIYKKGIKRGSERKKVERRKKKHTKMDEEVKRDSQRGKNTANS